MNYEVSRRIETYRVAWANWAAWGSTSSREGIPENVQADWRNASSLGMGVQGTYLSGDKAAEMFYETYRG